MLTSMSFRSFQILLFIKEELRTAVEAEVLDAAGEVDIAGEDAEALNCAYVAKVNDYPVWQWLHVLTPSGVPIGLFVAVNQTLCNTFTKFFGIGEHNIPLIFVDDVAALVNEFNLADARVFVVICCLDIDA